MHRTTLLLLATTLGGCDFFQDVGNAIEGAFEPIGGIAITVNVDAPSTDVLNALGVDGLDDLAIPEEYDGGVGSTAYLADARSANDINNALVTGATMVLEACGESADMLEEASGYHYADNGELDNCDGPFEIRRLDVDPNAYLPMWLPNRFAANTVPTTWEKNKPMNLALDAPGVTHGIVIVADATSGSITFTNEPQSAGDWFNLITGSQDLANFGVPASAFPKDGVYAVLTIGLQRTDNLKLDEVNNIVSVAAGGRGMVWPVVVGNPI